MDRNNHGGAEHRTSNTPSRFTGHLDHNWLSSHVGLFNRFRADPQRARAMAAEGGGGPQPIVSFVSSRFEDGAWSGVPRFDYELRRVFPDLISLRSDRMGRDSLCRLADARPDTVVITNNHKSLAVPETLRTIVVHHGCAQTHFDRDPTWRTRATRRMCAEQRDMYTRRNRWFVAPAAWTAREFSRHYQTPVARVIPHWVEPYEWPARPRGARPVVLGDFRDWNKGRRLVRRLSAALPECEMRALSCTYHTRQQAYRQADVYVSLSVSEGGSYALCDAEAAGMPIVMTDVGNCVEFVHARRISWQEREDIEQVARTVRRALEGPRGPSFYANFDFTAWSGAWRALVDEVGRSDAR